MYKNLCDYINDELEELDKKVSKGGKLSGQDLEFADKMMHLKKNMMKAEEMEAGGYGYDNGYIYSDRQYPGTYWRGSRSSGRSRDSMGRYRDNDMMADLEDLMNRSPNDKVRRKYEDFMGEIRDMM